MSRLCMCTCWFYLWYPAVWREWAGFPCLGALINFQLLVLRNRPEGQHSESSRPLRPDFLLNIILLVLLVLQQSAIQHMHHHRCGKMSLFFFYRSQMRKTFAKIHIWPRGCFVGAHSPHYLCTHLDWHSTEAFNYWQNQPVAVDQMSRRHDCVH